MCMNRLTSSFYSVLRERLSNRICSGREKTVLGLETQCAKWDISNLGPSSINFGLESGLDDKYNSGGSLLSSPYQDSFSGLIWELTIFLLLSVLIMSMSVVGRWEGFCISFGDIIFCRENSRSWKLMINQYFKIQTELPSFFCAILSRSLPL